MPQQTHFFSACFSASYTLILGVDVIFTSRTLFRTATRTFVANCKKRDKRGCMREVLRCTWGIVLRGTDTGNVLLQATCQQKPRATCRLRDRQLPVTVLVRQFSSSAAAIGDKRCVHWKLPLLHLRGNRLPLLPGFSLCYLWRRG